MKILLFFGVLLFLAFNLIPRDRDTPKAVYFSVSAEQFQVLPLSDLQSTLAKLDSKYSNR